MRKYQPIWERLKLYHTAKLAAPIGLHARIVKAVIKEKYMDIGWKLLCSETGNSYKLFYKIESTLITFSLEVERSIKNL